MSEEESPHITSLRKQWKLNRLAKKQSLDDAEALQALNKALATSTAREKHERPAAPGIGDLIEGKGILLGTWAPKDNAGKSLGKVFNIYAAPNDLHKMIYADAVKYVAALEDWHGHDGAEYLTDKELREALRDGSYNGGWIIPPRELLVGKNMNGEVVQSDNLYVHQDKGALRQAFPKMVMNGQDHSNWYWSSTELPDFGGYMFNARFSDGGGAWDHFSTLRLHCRPVRLEPV